MKKNFSILIFTWLAAHVFYASTFNQNAAAEKPQSPPVLKDFAYGIVLTAEEDSAICKITLSEDIYQHVTRDDLGDIRVFNKQGEVVPHGIRSPKPLPATPESADLPFFPLVTKLELGNEETGNKPDGLTIRFSINKDGTIIDVGDKSGNSASSGAVNAYLIDASTCQQRIDKLYAEWTDSGDSFIATVSIDSSSDLTHWQQLVRKATLAELRYSGHKLGQHIITLPQQNFKYLRMSWQPGRQGTRITRISAMFSPVTGELSRQWINTTGNMISENPVMFEFNTEGKFPADRVNIRLPRRNSLIQGVLKSRKHKQDTWKFRHSGIFYNLHIEGTVLVNDPIRLSSLSDPYWRLEISPDSGISGKEPPILEVGWIPHDLVFLAQGEGPFTLAYGSKRVKTSGRPVDILLNTITDKQSLVKTAVMGDRIELGGKSAIMLQPEPFPWKKWILWAVLVAGVFLLGWMAWQLWSMMNG